MRRLNLAETLQGKAPMFLEALVNSHLEPLGTDGWSEVFDKVRMLAILLDLEYIPSGVDEVNYSLVKLEFYYLQRISSLNKAEVLMK